MCVIKAGGGQQLDSSARTNLSDRHFSLHSAAQPGIWLHKWKVGDNYPDHNASCSFPRVSATCPGRVSCQVTVEAAVKGRSRQLSPCSPPLPDLSSMCRRCCWSSSCGAVIARHCLTHTCWKISIKSCNEILAFQSQGHLFSSEDCPFPHRNIQDPKPENLWLCYHPDLRRGRKHWNSFLSSPGRFQILHTEGF